MHPVVFDPGEAVHRVTQLEDEPEHLGNIRQGDIVCPISVDSKSKCAPIGVCASQPSIP